MRILLCVLSMLYIKSTQMTAATSAEQFLAKVQAKQKKEKLSGPGIPDRPRPKTAQFTPSPHSAFYKGNLPQINTASCPSSEYSVGTDSTSSMSSFSDQSVSPIIPSPPAVAPSNRSLQSSKFLRDRRLAQQYSTLSLTPEDQHKIAQAYSYIAAIRDSEIQHQARIKVGEAITPEDKEQLAIAWKEYISKIEDDAGRAAAARNVQTTPTEFKQCVAEAWLEHLIKIPAGPIRNKAIEEVRDAGHSYYANNQQPTAEDIESAAKDKKITAKVWQEYLAPIENEYLQSRMASMIRRVSGVSKELLIKGLRPAEKKLIIDAAPAMQEPKTNSLWKTLSAIKDMGLKNEAYQYISQEIQGAEAQLQMARIWVNYLANIKDETARKAAIEEVKSADPIRWEDVASGHHLQYTLNKVALSNQEY
ncbi:MAG: hypothetical protein LW696_03525 [Alphaproteobacteria bacterium]|jgi:hypothetical protein|nr:hypothetical protein [Alphaproteobacteria bacterium]